MILIDTGLLNKALEAIELNPEQHVQSEWRCETGQCLAGWIGVVTGTPWALPDDKDDANIIRPDGSKEHIMDYARELLGGRKNVTNLSESEFYEIYGPEGRPSYTGAQFNEDTHKWNITEYETYGRALSVDDGYITFDLFAGMNTREQLRGALRVIEQRQSK